MKAFKGMCGENPKFTYNTRDGCVFTLHLMTQAKLLPWTVEPAERLIFLDLPGISYRWCLSREEIFQDYLLLKSGNQGRDENEVSTLFFCVKFCLFCFILFRDFCYLFVSFGGKEIRQMNKTEWIWNMDPFQPTKFFPSYLPIASPMLHLLYILI